MLRTINCRSFSGEVIRLGIYSVKVALLYVSKGLSRTSVKPFLVLNVATKWPFCSLLVPTRKLRKPGTLLRSEVILLRNWEVDFFKGVKDSRGTHAMQRVFSIWIEAANASSSRSDWVVRVVEASLFGKTAEGSTSILVTSGAAISGRLPLSVEEMIRSSGTDSAVF